MTNIILVLALAGCKSDQKLNRNLGDNIGADEFAVVEVSPEFHDFGDLASAEVATQVVTVTNVGTAMSKLAFTSGELTMGESSGFSIIQAAEATELGENESVEIVVAFTASAPDEVIGQIVVVTDDEERPQIPVGFAGAGRMGQLEIEPDPLTYTPTMIGCPVDDEFLLRNVGNDTLVVDAMAVEGTGFNIRERPILPLTLEPGDEVPVSMNFAPAYSGAFTGALVVESTDSRGTVRAVQEGTAEEPGECLDSYLVPHAGKLDILFVVDQSNSMAGIQTLLAEQATAVGTALTAVTDDVQVGVVTNDSGCLVGGIMTPTTEDFPAKFTEAVQTGDEMSDGYHYTEALIYLAWKAVIENSGARGCNEGFAREDALLHVIVVTDEAYDLDGFVDQSWWSMLEDVRMHQEGSYLVKFSAVAKPGAAGAYGDIVLETRGTLLNIEGVWSAEIDTVAASNITMDTFYVTSPVDLATMRVYLDHVLMATGWRYRSEIHSVITDEGVSTGHLLEMDYVRPVDCSLIEDGE